MNGTFAHFDGPRGREPECRVAHDIMFRGASGRGRGYGVKASLAVEHHGSGHVRSGGDQQEGLVTHGIPHELGLFARVQRVGVDAQAFRVGAHVDRRPAHDCGTGGITEDAPPGKDQCALRQRVLEPQPFRQPEAGDAAESGGRRRVRILRGAGAQNQYPADVPEGFRLGDGLVAGFQGQDQPAGQGLDREHEKEGDSHAGSGDGEPGASEQTHDPGHQQDKANQWQGAEQGGDQFGEQHAERVPDPAVGGKYLTPGERPSELGPCYRPLTAWPASMYCVDSLFSASS